MKKRQIIIVAVALTVLIGSFALSGILSGMKEPPEVKPQPEVKKYVKTQQVKYGNIPTNVVAYGRVQASQSLDLIAEVSGRMTNYTVPLKEGQSFKKGAILYRIDDTEARLNLQSQKSNFLRDLAAVLPDIKIDYNSEYQKWQDYFTSINLNSTLPELPSYSSNQEKTFLATKNIFSTYYTIKSAEVNLSKFTYRAPFSGIISNVSLQSGSFVNPGNKIATILRSDQLEMKVDVATSDIDWISMGAPAQVTTKSGNIWDGRVVRVGEFVNQNTQSIDVFIAIQPQQGKRLYDGEYLESTIPGKVIDSGMEIPRNAVFDDNKVYVLQDSLLKVREVNVHKINPETIIFSGLTKGSDVVVEPLINAHNNMKAFKLEEKGDIDIEQKSSEDDQLVKS